MPKVCLHKILVCHHAFLHCREGTFPSTIKLVFELLKWNQGKTMAPNCDESSSNTHRNCDGRGSINCFLLYEPHRFDISRHVGETSQRMKRKSYSTSHSTRRGSFHHQGPFEIHSILRELHKMIKNISHWILWCDGWGCLSLVRCLVSDGRPDDATRGLFSKSRLVILWQKSMRATVLKISSRQ